MDDEQVSERSTGWSDDDLNFWPSIGRVVYGFLQLIKLFPADG